MDPGPGSEEGIRIKKHFPCVGPITNFIEIIVKL